MTKKDMNELASKIAKKEKGKSKVSIGDIREILRILSELIKKDPKILLKLVK